MEKFVQLNTPEDYEKYFVPTFGGELDEGLEAIQGAWWELVEEEQVQFPNDPKLKTMFEILKEDEEAEFIYIWGENRIDLMRFNSYIEEMGEEYSLYFDMNGPHYEMDAEAGEPMLISLEAVLCAKDIHSTEDLYEFMSTFKFADEPDELEYEEGDSSLIFVGNTVYVDGDRIITDGDGWTGDCTIPFYCQYLLDNYYRKDEDEYEESDDAYEVFWNDSEWGLSTETFTDCKEMAEWFVEKNILPELGPKYTVEELIEAANNVDEEDPDSNIVYTITDFIDDKTYYTKWWKEPED